MKLGFSEELAEFTGILLGDGSIGKYNCKAENSIKTQYRVKVTGDSTEDLSYFTDFIKPLMTRLFRKEPLLRFKKNERTIELLFFGCEVYESLLEVRLKVSPKRNRMVIPKFIVENGFEHSFLRGLFDTDGCVVFDKQHQNIHYYPRLEIKISPSPMRDQILYMLSDLGFSYITSPQPFTKKVIRIQINGKRQLVRWSDVIGFNNPKHETKYLIWKKLGYCPPHTTLKYRLEMLAN